MKINQMMSIMEDEALMEIFLDKIEELRDEPHHKGTSTSRLCEDMALYYQPSLEDAKESTLIATADAELEFLIYQQMLDNQKPELAYEGFYHDPKAESFDDINLFDASTVTAVESTFDPVFDNGTYEAPTMKETLQYMIMAELNNGSDRMEYASAPTSFIRKYAVDVHSQPIFNQDDRAKLAEQDFWKMKGQQRFKKAFKK